MILNIMTKVKFHIRILYVFLFECYVYFYYKHMISICLNSIFISILSMYLLLANWLRLLEEIWNRMKLIGNLGYLSFYFIFLVYIYIRCFKQVVIHYNGMWMSFMFTIHKSILKHVWNVKNRKVICFQR